MGIAGDFWIERELSLWLWQDAGTRQREHDAIRARHPTRRKGVARVVSSVDGLHDEKLMLPGGTRLLYNASPVSAVR